MNDKLNYLSETKSAIKDAISAKGVSVSENDTFRSYADKINLITSGVTPTGTVCIIQNNTVNLIEVTVTFPDSTTSISDLWGAFCGPFVTSVDFNNVKSIGEDGLSQTFSGCYNLTTVNFKNVTSIGKNGLDQTFYGCDKLTTVNFENVTSIGENGLSWTFVSENPKGGPSLSLSFPAVTSSSFPEGTSIFDHTCMGRAGCTVHFPSNLESVLGSRSDIIDGIDCGEDTTILFDLPATT